MKHAHLQPAAILHSCSYIIFGLFLGILGLSLSGNIIDGINLLYTREFNPDEFQHAHIIWDIVNGKIIYKDFFEHHGPLFPILSSIFFKLFNYKPGFNTLYSLRLHSFILMILILFLTFKITQFLTKSALCGLFSASLLSGFHLFINHGMEIRPDILQNVFFLGGVYVFLRYLEKRSPFWLSSGGLLLGLSVLTNDKAGLAVAGFILFMITDGFIKKDFKGFLKTLSVFTCGFLVPLASACIYFFFHRALLDYLCYSFYFNFLALPLNHSSLFFTRNMFTDEDALCFIVLLGLILLLHAAYLLYASKRYDAELLFIWAVVLSALSVIPFRLYEHNFLSVLPGICIGAVFGFYRFFQMHKRTSPDCFFEIMLELLIFMVFFSHLDRTFYFEAHLPMDAHLQKQTAVINYLLRETPRSEPILLFTLEDGGGVFNEDVQYYWTGCDVDHSIFDRLAHYSVLGAKLIRHLEEEHVRYITLSTSTDLGWLPEISRTYIQSHFKPTGFYDLFERQ